MRMMYANSQEKLEKLDKVLEKMVASGVIWSKASICRLIGANQALLSPSVGKTWGAAVEAKRRYQEACDRIREKEPQNIKVLVKPGTTDSQAEYLEDYCEELTDYNKRLIKLANTLKAKVKQLESELKQERDRVTELEEELAKLKGTQKAA